MLKSKSLSPSRQTEVVTPEAGVVRVVGEEDVGLVTMLWVLPKFPTLSVLKRE
jgi:hypothetical protein